MSAGMKNNAHSRSRVIPLRSFCRIAVLMLPAGAHAQTWDGGGSSDLWSAGANWSSNVPPVNNGTASLLFGGGIRLNPVLDTSYAAASLTFAANAGAFTLGSANDSKLRIGGGGITNNSAQTQTFSLGSLLGGGVQVPDIGLVLTASQTWNAAAGDLHFGKPVNLGAHTLTLAGSGETVFSGGGFLNPGGLVGSGSVIIANGATGRFGVPGIQFNGNITLESGGTLISQGTTSTGQGTLTLKGGTFRSEDLVNPGQVRAATTIAGNVLMDGTRALSFVYDPVSVSGNRTLNVTNSSGGGIEFFEGLDIGGGQALTRIGSGRLTLGDTDFVNGINTRETSLAGSLDLNQGITFLNGRTTLSGSGRLNLSDTLAPGSTFVRSTYELIANPGALVTMNGGTLNLDGKGSLILDGGSLNRTGGDLTLSNGGSLVLKNSGDAQLTGSFNPGGGGTVSVSGNGSLLTTTGDMSIAGNAGVSVSGGGAAGIGGRLNVGLLASPGTLVAEGPGSILTIGGGPRSLHDRRGHDRGADRAAGRGGVLCQGSGHRQFPGKFEWHAQCRNRSFGQGAGPIVCRGGGSRRHQGHG